MNANAVIPVPWDYLQDNLVAQAQIARRLRIDRSVLTRWKKYADWPAPVLTFPAWTISAIGELWWWPDVQAFCDRHNVTPGKGMRRGRPAKEAAS